jgi:YHS domain-containing protein
MPETPAPKSSFQLTVCGREMTTAPENYYAAEYQGQTIYFCTSFCLDAFNADPERFYLAHSKNKSKGQPSFEARTQ